jgi:hypothetical protein
VAPFVELVVMDEFGIGPLAPGDQPVTVCSRCNGSTGSHGMLSRYVSFATNHSLPERSMNVHKNAKLTPWVESKS